VKDAPTAIVASSGEAPTGSSRSTCPTARPRRWCSGRSLAVFAPHRHAPQREPIFALAPLSHDGALSMAHAVLSRIPCLRCDATATRPSPRRCCGCRTRRRWSGSTWD
jgi:hypothetical protein